MQLLRTITDSDFDGGEPEMLELVSRHASRGVLMNDHFQVAMMYMAKLGLYKLPGGGIEAGEDAEEAFIREIREETGCTASIVQELGYIDEHKNRNRFFQRSFSYIAKVVDLPGATSLSDNEIKLGMQVKWVHLNQAIVYMNSPVSDYSTRFMMLRDRIILEEAVHWLNKQTNLHRGI
ncbi:NUDIX hydrolase [Paenibacillus sp. CF384]|uniref:NUDIX hydrolase n=1 Tax=Paenibacillus sp. CF384 TaxID=1884382 RepID=UPI00089D8532|nr:NUDIX domain-containing protein [Paenibacillus sp. CF384]SDW85730.1 8-oxo-dGTP diphosphatase [Paenibacillus sp. CF384]